MRDSVGTNMIWQESGQQKHDYEISDQQQRPFEDETPERHQTAVQDRSREPSPPHSEWKRLASGNDEEESRLEKLQRGQQSEELRNLPCPFRKRNPARFNVRAHRSCAIAPCSNLPQLKSVPARAPEAVVPVYMDTLT